MMAQVPGRQVPQKSCRRLAVMGFQGRRLALPCQASFAGSKLGNRVFTASGNRCVLPSFQCAGEPGLSGGWLAGGPWSPSEAHSSQLEGAQDCRGSCGLYPARQVDTQQAGPPLWIPLLGCKGSAPQIACF